MGEPEVPPTAIPFGHAEPHGVYADDQEPVSAEMASLTSEKRIDPALDFAWAAGQRAAQGGAAAAAEGWEKFWLDEKVPALFGRTPRQAARGRERPYLEALLRQFEYEADLLAADSKTGVDTAWLREQLDMPCDLAD